MKKLLAVLGIAAATAAGASAQIAQWTFEGNVTSTAVGSGNASITTNGTLTFPTGVAINGIGSSSAAWNSNGWNSGEYFQFQISTTGFSGLNVSFFQTSSSTGPRDFIFQYSTNGTSFTDFSTYQVLLNGSPTWAPSVTNDYTPYRLSFDLSAVTALNNQPTVFFRLTNTGNVSAGNGTVAGAGTSRIDNFTVIPEPSTWALIGVGIAFMIWHIRRKRSMDS